MKKIVKAKNQIQQQIQMNSKKPNPPVREQMRLIRAESKRKSQVESRIQILRGKEIRDKVWLKQQVGSDVQILIRICIR